MADTWIEDDISRGVKARLLALFDVPFNRVDYFFLTRLSEVSCLVPTVTQVKVHCQCQILCGRYIRRQYVIYSSFTMNDGNISADGVKAGGSWESEVKWAKLPEANIVSDENTGKKKSSRKKMKSGNRVGDGGYGNTDGAYMSSITTNTMSTKGTDNAGGDAGGDAFEDGGAGGDAGGDADVGDDGSVGDGNGVPTGVVPVGVPPPDGEAGAAGSFFPVGILCVPFFFAALASSFSSF